MSTLNIQLLCGKLKKKKKHTKNNNKQTKKTKNKYRYLLSDQAPWLTLSGLNYQYLEHFYGPEDVRAIEVRLYTTK